MQTYFDSNLPNMTEFIGVNDGAKQNKDW